MASSLSLDAAPIQSGFPAIFLRSQFLYSPKWPSKSKTNLAGQVAVITGGSAGLGLVAGSQLLALGLARLVLAVRSLGKGERAAGGLRKNYPDAKIDVWELEMESYASMQAFAARVGRELDRVDIVILNAGIIAADFARCAETGHEKVIQVNYLSTMLLAVLLLPVLKAKGKAAAAAGTAPVPRLTIVNSGVALASRHPWANTRPLLPSFDDTSIQEFEFNERYHSSKLLGQLFFIKLFQHVSADDVVVNLVDPGLVRGTALQGNATGWLGWLGTVLTGRSLAAGGSTYVDAAVVKGAESHGCFVMDWEIRPFAAFAYTSEGKECIEVLWKETMDEFEFAGARGILESLKN